MDLNLRTRNSNNVIHEPDPNNNVLAYNYGDTLKQSDEARTEPDLEESVNNMSIDDTPLNFTMPDASNLMTDAAISEFSNHMCELFRKNRKSIDLKSISNTLINLAYDNQTGLRYFTCSYNYMNEHECRSDPVGLKCLEGSGCNSVLRRKAVATLFRICRRLDCEQYSVHQGVMYLDRFMKRIDRKLSNEEYLTAAIACWYMAVKFDLVIYPNLEDACQYGQGAKPNNVCLMENEILSTLRFNLNLPTPIIYLRPFSMIYHARDKSHNIAKMLLDISYFYYEFSGHLSVVLATASYITAVAIVERKWDLEKLYPPAVQFVSGLTVENVLPIVKQFCVALIDIYDNMSLSIYYEIRFRHGATLSELIPNIRVHLERIIEEDL